MKALKSPAMMLVMVPRAATSSLPFGIIHSHGAIGAG